MAELLRFATDLVAGFAFAAGLAEPFAFAAAAAGCFAFAVSFAAAGLAASFALAAGAGCFFAVFFAAAGLVEDFRVAAPATARGGLADLEPPGCSEAATVPGFVAAALSLAPDTLPPCFAPSRPVVSAMIYVPVVML
ncbi:hypothetical protein [Novosphingobium endophyticum]|uniref:hypothetical protein n=1 Tax=Novosphingobium endophyticum TaxID=1955250 RepID=UPI0016660911|nr:hypothetical protein [Novosphingobium endophyticum]